MAAECCAGAVTCMLVVAHRVSVPPEYETFAIFITNLCKVIPFPGLPKWGMYRRTGAEPALPEPQNCIKRRACASAQRILQSLTCSVAAELDKLARSEVCRVWCHQNVRYSPYPPRGHLLSCLRMRGISRSLSSSGRSEAVTWLHL